MPSGPTAEPVGLHRAALGESPLWDADRAALVWLDILGETLLVTDPATGSTTATALPFRAGSVNRAEGGGLVAAAGQALYHLSQDGTIAEIARLPDGAAGRFNDGKADAAGRLFVGTARADGIADCALWRIEAGAALSAVLGGIAMSNGLGWSGDGRTLYYVDSLTGRLDALDFHPADGSLGARRSVLQLPVGQLPDGLAVDTLGRVWLAVWGGSAVLAVTPDGRIDRTVRLPTSRVASCAFGGGGYRTLFITTAQEGASPEELAADPHAGALFAVDVGAEGLPANRVRLR